MKIARASKEIIVVRYYPFPKMLPSIHRRLPFLDLNLRDFALQGTSWVAEFHTKFAQHHPRPRERLNFGPPPPPHRAKKENATAQSGANKDQTNSVALFDFSSSVCLFVI
jgi:hypothetical protein